MNHTAITGLESWLSQQIIGQTDLVRKLLIAVLADGHLLVEGAPGLAKTRAIKMMAEGVEGDFHRVQFTPDLLPGDVTGTDVFRPQLGTFEFQAGPIFHNLVLADEINRAPAKVQSALLEAMAERQVSVGATTYPLPALFLVMATQNPIEQEGTYPLPEAQLDRFLLQVNVDYPDPEAERQMLLATTGVEERHSTKVMDASQLMLAQNLVRRLPVGESVVEAILALVRSGRPGVSDRDEVKESVAWGPGPRASQALMLATRARALLQGRVSPSIDDVVALAPAILRHRMALNFAARADGQTLDAVISHLCDPFR